MGRAAMMDSPELWPVELFDPEADVLIVERRLPHWTQAGAICFITFRTHDSMPKAVLDDWFADRARWLREHGIDPNASNWKVALEKLDQQTVRAFLDRFWNRWHDALDACHGACLLRSRELSKIVSDSLNHFDGERYLMLDYVVMPNHIHMLCSFPDEEVMLAMCASWKHYTAVRINRRLAQQGRLWQQDGFDHLVRSETQFQYLRRYIAANPEKAGLRTGEYVCYTRQPLS